MSIKKQAVELDAALLPQAEAVLSRLIGSVELKGRELLMLNEERGDNSLGSFKFNIDTGAWADFAAGDMRGHGIVGLVSKYFTLSTQAAITKIREELGDTYGTQAHSRENKRKPPLDPEIRPVNESTAHAEGIDHPFDCHPDLGPPSAVYAYRIPGGEIAFFVYRFDLADGKKETRPVSYSAAKKQWVWKFPPTPWPLYWKGPRDAEKIIVVEGEKCAEAAAEIFPDCAVVTSSTGAERAGMSTWEGLKGKEVLILPDHDEPGSNYAHDVAGFAFVHRANDIQIADTSSLGWEKGDDIADHKDLGESIFDALRPWSEFDPSKREKGLVKALAALAAGDYDRIRAEAAKSLGIGVQTMNKLVKAIRTSLPDDDSDDEDEVETLRSTKPCDGDVNSEEVFQEIVGVIKKHVFLDDGATVAIAMWILMSWVNDQLYILPQLLLTSPIKQCGKTTTLSVIQALVNRPLASGNISAAAIYRAIEEWKPTLLLDEADTYLRKNIELAGVLNSGHTRETAFVTRVTEIDGKQKPVRFSTWAPKVIAGIGVSAADTTIDRSVIIRLQRKPADMLLSRLALRFSDDMEPLRSRIARWAVDVKDVQIDESALNFINNDRARDNWAALLAVARHVGKVATEALLAAARAMSDNSDLSSDREGDLLRDLKVVIAEIAAEAAAKKTDATLLPTKVILDKLNKLEDSQWTNFNRGTGLNGHGLARMLKLFGLASTIKKAAETKKTVRGYLAADFTSVFARYLSDRRSDESHEEPST